MKKAILKRFVVVIFVSLLVCGTIFCIFITNFSQKQTQRDMIYALELLDYNLVYTKPLKKQIDLLNPVTMEDNTRITIISTTGELLADTSNFLEQPENHAGRLEFQQALEEGYGFAHRFSGSLNKNMLYVAKFSQKGNCVLRLSIPYSGFMTYAETILPAICVSMAVAFLLAAILAKRFSKTITEPLEEISAELLELQNPKHIPRFEEYQYEELNSIVISTVKLSDRINKTVKKLKYERNKVDYILENMSEGLILLNEDQEVMTLNQAARKILNYQGMVEPKNIVHYTQNMDIIKGVEQAAQNREVAAFDLYGIDHRIYSTYISTVKRGVFNENTSGIIVLLIDVTSDRKSQQMRQEFFSNVSHELKTPITSIQGYAELLGEGVITDDQKKKEFLQRIKTETRNMTNLINDILMISRLENKAVDENILPVKIRPIIKEVITSVTPLAVQSEVALHWKCSEVIFRANAQQMHQLINNLVVNAIKYNKPGGTVTVTAGERNGSFFLTVADTGIGIPQESQQRVFERFFRVDKGRSRRMGGTGLGLSIVKHIVQFYNGSIQLESRVGIGTTIQVEIPMDSQIEFSQ